MEQLENIKTLILPVLDSLGIQLYELKRNPGFFRSQ